MSPIGTTFRVTSDENPGGGGGGGGGGQSEVLAWEAEEEWSQSTLTRMASNELGDNEGPGAVNNGYPLGSITEGLAAYYPYDGNADDATGLGSDGSVNGATLAGTGQVGSNSYDFDGVDDVITVANPSPAMHMDIWTVCLWVNPDTNDQVVLQKRVEDNPDVNFTLGYNTSDEFFLNHTIGGTFNSVVTTDTFALDTWYHFGLVNDGNQLKIYADGSISETSANGGSSDRSSNQELRVGSNVVSGSPAYFDGSIDDLRIYDRVLSQPEIEAIANRTQTSSVSTEDTLA